VNWCKGLPALVIDDTFGLFSGISRSAAVKTRTLVGREMKKRRRFREKMKSTEKSIFNS
jgi:hypothetical protein